MFSKLAVRNAVLTGNLDYVTHVVEQKDGKVDLSNYEITDEEAIIMADKFFDDCGVETLDLSHNAVGDKGTQAIANFIKNMGLTHLNLSHNHITDVGAQRLLNVIQSPRYWGDVLETIDVSGNEISPEMEQKIMDAMDLSRQKSVEFKMLNPV